MQKFLMTTALVIPLSAGIAMAQTATTDTTTMAPAATGTMATDSTTMPADTTTMPATGTAATGTMASDPAAMPATGTMTTDTTMPAGTAATGTMPAGTATMPATGTAATGTMTTDTTTMPATTDAAVATPADVVRQQAANELRVDWITGTAVTSTDGENVGDVNDVIIDGDTGMMKAVIVGVGGFLGIGEKQIAIDWSKLTVNYDANQIMTSITREEAGAAPAYQFREQTTAPAPAATTVNGTATTAPVVAPVTDPAATTTTTTTPATN